ncbi:MAG: sigma 54-interacting transcriptional regulator [Candidatus Binatia bacterium]
MADAGAYRKPNLLGRSPLASVAELDRHQLLLEVANLLTTKLEPDLLFETIAQVLLRLLHVERASLAIYDPERDEFEVVALALQEETEHGKGWLIPHHGSRVGKAFDTRRPYLSSALGKGAPFYEDPPLVKEGMHSGLTIPLIVGARAIGTFNVNCRRESALDNVDIDLLTKIADQIAIAVANSQAFQLIRREKEGLQRENEYLAQATKVGDEPNLLLNCPSMRPWIDRLMTLAKVDATVLITGETGVGKGVVARALHAWSSRRDRPFVKCDCAALVPSLIESELFGHEKGAFTGAHSRRIGRFELAEAGTIFLDEIAEIPPETQAKLLGVLEDRQIQRVGSSQSIAVDIRVIAATNRDLRAEVEAGRFRQDLFYRLNVLSVHLPPLRERPDDLTPLAEYFIRLYSRAFGGSVREISPAALAAMSGYHWPGNIRELGNLIERAMLLGSGPVLNFRPELFSPSTRPVVAATAPPRVEMIPLAEVEARHISNVLREMDWRIAGPRGAAKILGLHPNTLRSRMARLGIRLPGTLARRRPRVDAPNGRGVSRRREER